MKTSRQLISYTHLLAKCAEGEELILTQTWSAGVADLHLKQATLCVCVCVCVCVCRSGLAHCIFQRSPYEVCVYVLLGLEHAAIV